MTTRDSLSYLSKIVQQHCQLFILGCDGCNPFFLNLPKFRPLQQLQRFSLFTIHNGHMLPNLFSDLDCSSCWKHINRVLLKLTVLAFGSKTLNKNLLAPAENQDGQVNSALYICSYHEQMSIRLLFSSNSQFFSYFILMDLPNPMNVYRPHWMQRRKNSSTFLYKFNRFGSSKGK